jgi:hypothetical protein
MEGVVIGAKSYFLIIYRPSTACKGKWTNVLERHAAAEIAVNVVLPLDKGIAGELLCCINYFVVQSKPNG